MRIVDYLKDLVGKQKAGEPAGIYSVCTYNRYAVESTFRQALEDGNPVLIESTCNQVNHLGGYTGMTPGDFGGYIHEVAEEQGYPRERLILGGDHLGPYPFRGESAKASMEKAHQMVASYVSVGCSKIHLDASMRLGDDPGDENTPLDSEIIARRSAELAVTAEAAYKKYREEGGVAQPPLYVIGTEVPAPGGSDEVEEDLKVTEVSDFEETVSLAKKFFHYRGLEDAWERVIAVVVQPGVEHGDHTIVDYDRRKAAGLKAALKRHPNLVFEGHATDYQKPKSLKAMVEDGIAVLKVGPSLTFTVRETVFALSRIEQELLEGDSSYTLSRFIETLDEVMLRKPEHWLKHYTGDERKRAFARKYSFFDRARYYWLEPEVKRSLQLLLQNLRSVNIPLSILSQYMPVQFERVREGRLHKDPDVFIHDRVMDVLKKYAYASGYRKDWTSSRDD
jgi:D-tagatose-1,6-bisphosphate aldolase subunit GatZ/KbaZ